MDALRAGVVIEDWRREYNAVRPHKNLSSETALAYARATAAQAAGGVRATPSLRPLLDFALLRERYFKPKPERPRLSLPFGQFG